jgi:hypothetical protein
LPQQSKDGIDFPLYEQGGTMVFKDEMTVARSRADKSSTGSMKLINGSDVHEKTSEPDFMKYIKGVNLKQNDEAYLKKHFEEEDDDTV